MNPGTRKALVIARRSRKNLDFICAQKKQGADVEEFTQLLNSMLGMLISLNENYQETNAVSWDEVKKLGFEQIRIKEDFKTDEMPNLKPTETFSALIRNVRNAFAHDNFDLIGCPISSVKVWNFPYGRKSLKNRCWQAEITEEQLKQIAYLYINYVEKVYGHELAQDAT